MKTTYVWLDGELVVKGSTSRTHDSAYVQPDIQPYKSMIDGRMVTSRSHHRRHLKANNCVEVGNEQMQSRPKQSRDTRVDVLREQLSNMTHSQANQLLAKARDDLRFTNNPHRRR